MKLHVFENGVTDWVVAESVEEAASLYKKHASETGWGDESGMDLDFKMTPDHKVLTCEGFGLDDDGQGNTVRPASWYAKNRGKGFLMSSEY